MFKERLRDYRNSLGLTMRDFADKLGITESNYNMVENGKRNPSKLFMEKLVADSKKPEEFWHYGIEGDDYVDAREDLKSTRKAVEQIIELDLVKDANKLFSGNYQEGTLEQLLIMALKTDIEYLLKKKKE